MVATVCIGPICHLDERVAVGVASGERPHPLLDDRRVSPMK